MLSNAYFLAKFRFDTAENEPAKNLQKIAKIEIWRSRAERLLLAPRDGLDLHLDLPPLRLDAGELREAALDLSCFR